MKRIKKLIKGAMKSKMVYLATFIAGVAPYTSDLIGYASGISPTAGAWIGVSIIILRALTTTPLSEK